MCGFYDSHVVFGVTDSHCLISCYIQDLSQLVKCHTFVNACFCEFQITVATAYERDFRDFFQMLKYFVAAVVVIICILWKIDGHFLHMVIVFAHHFSDIVHTFSGCHDVFLYRRRHFELLCILETFVWRIATAVYEGIHMNALCHQVINY